MEKRILLSTRVTDLKTNQVAEKHEVIKKITLQTWLTDTIKELSDIKMTNQEIHNFVFDFLQYTPNINKITTIYREYEFLTNNVNLIN